MARRIDFINPFGTKAYDELIRRTLSHYASPDTQLTITHLTGCPPDIDYFYSKHLVELAVFERVMRAEEEGFDAVIVGCCYDPGVRVARELVDIPVIGTMEASMQMAPNFAHSYTIVTDHHKAAPYIDDYARTSGLGGNCRGVRTIEWFVRDMINDTDSVAKDTIETSRRVIAETRSEMIVMGCTIVAACYQSYLMQGNSGPEFTILNPNLMALKMAETMADLKQKGDYRLSRVGYYEKPKGHYRDEFIKARAQYQASQRALAQS
jgi:allantoin racemase